MSWICDSLQITRHLKSFVRMLYGGKVTGVSDGSYLESEGMSSAAWILYTPAGVTIEGAGMVPGTVLDHNSYRGELGGLLAQLLVIQKIEKIYTGPSDYPVTIACDGESALLKSLTSYRTKISSSDKAYDIISRVADIRKKLRAKIIPVHVEGHVDDTGRELSTLERMNCRMDSNAKSIMHRALTIGVPRVQMLPPSASGIAPVTIGGVEINSELTRSLRFHIGKTRILKWWLYKGWVSREAIPDIHWSITQGTMSEATFSMNKFMSKWVAGQFGVGVVMEYRKSRMDNGCPRCYEQIEDPLHVLQCPHPTARTEWDRLIGVLQEWMRKVDTHPSIRSGISQVLWHYSTPSQDIETFIPPNLDSAVKQCFKRQARLGWTQFLQGLFTRSWAPAQDAYYKSKGSRKQGRRWAVNLSKQLWWIVFGMWDHRNQEMFSGKVDTLSGEELLKRAIRTELNRGIDGLSPLYSKYFKTSTKALFLKPIRVIKQWLVVVRKGRIEQRADYNDDIQASIEVQEWIGLITKEEANRLRRIARENEEN